MKGTIEENTDEFYKELNGNCDPDKLLEIAKQGIYLYEPLFKYEKIKNHVNVVEISILAGQYFMINNDEQFEKFDILLSNDDFMYELFEDICEPSYISTESDCLKLIIPNKFFIDKYLFEGFTCNFKIKYSGIIQEWLFYLYKYYYITRDDFINFYYNWYTNIKFIIFEYFYYGNKKYLEDLFEKCNSYIKFKILYEILAYCSYDINILKYCASIVERYTNISISSDVIYEIFKKGKKIRKFYGEVSSHELRITNNRFSFYYIYVKEYFLSNIIDSSINKQSYIQILYEGIDKFNKSDITYTEYNLINFLFSENNNIQKFKWSGSNRDCESILCSNDRYYNNYEFFDNLLKNPKYIFEINKYDILYDKDRHIVLFYYLISLFHNNIYNEEIIDFLTSTVFFNDIYLYDNTFRKFSLLNNEHIIQLYTIFKKIPHEEFRKYIDLE